MADKNRQEDLLTRLNRYYPRMSKGQRLLCRYIQAHFAEVTHMTAEALGASVGVSESTVVRFAVFLGYEGYPQLRRAAGRYANAHLNPVQRLQNQYAGCSSAEILKDVLQADANQIRTVQDYMDPQAFSGVVDLILSADRLYVLGKGNMTSLAGYLAHGLQMIFKDVTLLHNTADIADLLPVLHIGRGDMLIAVGSEGDPEDLMKLLLFARAREARILTFFVDAAFRACADGDCTGFKDRLEVHAESRFASYFSVLHALLTALFLKKPDVIHEGEDALKRLMPESGEL